MNDNFTVRKATENDISLIENLIKGLAAYEKRPQDMTATKEDLHYWLFEKNIATALIAEYNGETVGYAIYYPIFASFAARGGVHLEDIFLKEENRGGGLGTKFFSEIEKFVKQDGAYLMLNDKHLILLHQHILTLLTYKHNTYSLP